MVDLRHLLWKDEPEDVQIREAFLARIADQHVKDGIIQFGILKEPEVIRYAVAQITRQAEDEKIVCPIDRVYCAAVWVFDPLADIARRQRIEERYQRRLRAGILPSRIGDSTTVKQDGTSLEEKT